MPLFPSLRKRTASQPVSGANIRIRQGVFGVGNPAFTFADVDPNAGTGIYNYHEGDLFTPGAGNFVFEPTFELPIETLWGFGFIRNPNTFSPLQQPQVFSPPTVVNNGIGGLVAGQIALQPLIEDDEGNGE